MNNILLASRNIFASDGTDVFSGTIIISDGIISAVHRRKPSAEEYSSCRTVIDCGDRLIIPGFCDSHIHGFLGSIQARSVDLTGCLSERDCVEKTASFYLSGSGEKAERGTEWLTGFGWNNYNWSEKTLPDRHSLDNRFGNTPVCLFNEEMHSAWLNSAALHASGITKNTPQPELGKIFTGDDGEPTGYLLEPDAMKPVFTAAFKVDQETEEGLYKSLLETAADYGITSISDIQIFNSLNCETYKKLLDEKKLSCRIYPVFPMNTDIEELFELRRRYDSDFLRFSGVKEFLDGTASMHTGVLVEPYTDRPGFNAEPLVDIEKTINRAILLDREGIRIRFHACGAGAVRLGLDIFEKVRKKNGFNDTRHTIEHIENIHPDDIPRFSSLGITASVQPDHLWSDTFAGHPFHSILGSERCRWAWPFRSILDSGAEMAFGTDYPVSPLNPMQGIYRAVSRLHEDRRPAGGWNPEEKLNVEESLTLYTAGSSTQMYAENLTGKLLPGFAADIAVIDGNLFRMEPEEIRRAGIYMTVSAGKIVKGPS